MCYFIELRLVAAVTAQPPKHQYKACKDYIKHALSEICESITVNDLSHRTLNIYGDVKPLIFTHDEAACWRLEVPHDKKAVSGIYAYIKYGDEEYPAEWLQEKQCYRFFCHNCDEDGEGHYASEEARIIEREVIIEYASEWGDRRHEA